MKKQGAGMHWFPFYNSDFIGDSAGMSCLETAMMAWMTVLYYELGPFPMDMVRVYRMTRCESDEQKRAVDYVLKERFEKRKDGYYNLKAERVKYQQNEVSESKRKAAKARWEQQQSISNADAMHMHSTRNANQNQNQNQKQTREEVSLGPVDLSKDTTTTTSIGAEPAKTGGGSGELPSIPVKGKNEPDFVVSPEFFAELKAAYPDVEVAQTLKEIRIWNIANGARKKPRADIPAHINTWMLKEHLRNE